MAKLIMKDGTVRNCDTAKAKKIQEIILGMAKPADKAQADFVATVLEVDFSDGVKVVHAEEPKHDDEIAKIMANPKLNGLQRARAVANRIKERTR